MGVLGMNSDDYAVLALLVAGVTMAALLFAVVIRGYRQERQVSRAHALAHPVAPAAPAPLNPYAMIALVSALLGLFWIALVYGILALQRPGGRGQAHAALALALAQLIVLAYLLSALSRSFTAIG